MNITITGTTASTVSPEGVKASMDLAKFLEAVCPPCMDTGEQILCDGIKSIQSMDGFTIVVHQSAPAIYNFKWIAKDSVIRSGRDAKYRNVRIALPYVILLATFQDGLLTMDNECYFRTSPLNKIDDGLLYPALLNVSKFPNTSNNRALTWICTQHLNFGKVHEGPELTRFRDSVAALWQCLIGAGFNYSSEANEGASWYGESCKVDKRIATIEDWQDATREDPLFAIDVPWLDTGHSLKKMCQRIFKRNVADAGPMTAERLATAIFNAKPQ